MPLWSSDPKKKAQVARDRADIAKTERATRQKAYTDKVRHEAIREDLDKGGTAEDAKFIDDFYGLLGGIKPGKIAKASKNKRATKETVRQIKKVEANPKLSRTVRNKAAKVRKQIEGK